MVGSDSNIRNRLTKLEKELNGQINQIIETRPNGYVFHHEAMKTVEAKGRELVNESLGAFYKTASTKWGASNYYRVVMLIKRYKVC